MFTIIIIHGGYFFPEHPHDDSLERRIHHLIHDNRPYRTDRCTVTAGQADFLIDFGKAVFIPEDGAVRTGGFAGAAAFAVILADTDTLFGNIGIVVGGHGTI